MFLACVTIINWSPRSTLIRQWIVNTSSLSDQIIILQRMYHFYSEVPRFFLIYVFFNWSIIALQNFVVFCQTSTWINHMHTYIPSLLNLPLISLHIPPQFPVYKLEKERKKRNEMDIGKLRGKICNKLKWPLRQCIKEKFPCFINIPIPVASPWCPKNNNKEKHSFPKT